jgi:hypothetical protein
LAIESGLPSIFILAVGFQEGAAVSFQVAGSFVPLVDVCTGSGESAVFGYSGIIAIISDSLVDGSLSGS